jgi:hypothetical protein
MYYGLDWTYILIIIAAIIAMIAQTLVSSTFSRYSKQRSASGITGEEAAIRILRANGINDVSVQRVSGSLTDHYDPSTKTVNLSETVFGKSSVAAVGVAAHECGHAIQHDVGYLPLTLRTALVPAANIGSKLSWVFIVVGLILSFNQTLITIGIFMFSLAVLFQLVTLPVEFNASARALEQLESQGILAGNELRGTRKVLSAAAFTYVASAASAILQLLRLIILFGGKGRDRR